jgi:hypothetical protein
MGASAAIAIGGATLISGAMEGENAKMQGKFQSSQEMQNARYAEMNAADAIKRGDKEAINVKNKANQLKGSQRAAMAAQGIDLSSGSSADIITETETMGSLDALTAKNNAYREAWGYRSEANNRRAAGKFARMAGSNAAQATLLTSGIKAADVGRDYMKKQGVQSAIST